LQNVEYRFPEPKDIDYLAKNMSEICIQEGSEVNQLKKGKDILGYYMKWNEQVIAIIVDGNCVAIMGYEEPNAETAAIWLVTSSKIAKYPLILCKTIKKSLEFIKGMYNYIFTYMPDNTTEGHKKWAKLLGFDITGDEVMFGKHKYRRVYYTGGASDKA